VSILNIWTLWRNTLLPSPRYQQFGGIFCLHHQGNSLLKELAASVFRVPTPQIKPMLPSSSYQHCGGICCLHLQGTSILNASPRYKHLGRKSQISNNSTFTSRIWKAFNRICKFFINTERKQNHISYVDCKTSCPH